MTLDRAWEDQGGAQPLQILDAYVTLPADFESFRQIANPYDQSPISWLAPLSAIDDLDPARTSSGSLLQYLVARDLSPVAATLGQTRYEAWPLVTSARSYPFLYKAKAAALSDDTLFTGILSDRALDVLKVGALKQASMWPGPSARRNPYFQLGTSANLAREWATLVQQCWLRDDEAFPEQFWVGTPAAAGSLSGSATLLRMSDATLDDYY